MTKQWSKRRPVRPATDPLYQQIRRLIIEDKRSTWAKANVSGLSPSTIKNWSEGRVSHPQGTSLQMAARMLGKKIILEDK